MKPLIIAHRGYSARYPDNTWTAIKSAFEAGADMCEVDLHMTDDFSVFVNHDYYVGGKLIADQKLRELKKLLPDNPDLEELVSWALKERKRFLLEVKDRRLIGWLPRYLEGEAKELFIVSSFDAVFLERFKDRNPEIKTCLLFGSVVDEESALELARKTGAEFVLPAWENRHPYPQELLTEEWIETLRSDGIYTICWHEEREDVLIELLERPVYGICTNDPVLLKRLRKEVWGE